jgi:hypothetical protein
MTLSQLLSRYNFFSQHDILKNMSYHVVTIEHPSPRVLGKLRKGGRVRVCHGTGMNLIVDAGKYNQLTRTFGKGRASTIALTPAEIEANLNPPVELLPQNMTGAGLFDNLKKGVKAIGRFVSPVAKEVGKVFLPAAKNIGKEVVQKAADYAPEVGATLGASALSGLALLAGQPELIPLAAAAGTTIGQHAGKTLGQYGQKRANRAIDNYDPFKNSPTPSPASRLIASNILNQPVAQGNLGTYLANLSLADLEGIVAQKRMSQGISPSNSSSSYDYSGGRRVLAPYTDPVGQGLYASNHSSRMSKRREEKSSVGVHGNLLGHGLPPALMSQPYGANYQWSNRLPPAYQVLNRGSGLS